MRDSLRDAAVLVGMVAALFAAFLSWGNARRLDRMAGSFDTLQQAVNSHVNTPHAPSADVWLTRLAELLADDRRLTAEDEP